MHTFKHRLNTNHMPHAIFAACDVSIISEAAFVEVYRDIFSLNPWFMSGTKGNS